MAHNGYIGNIMDPRFPIKPRLYTATNLIGDLFMCNPLEEQSNQEDDDSVFCTSADHPFLYFDNPEEATESMALVSGRTSLIRQGDIRKLEESGAVRIDWERMFAKMHFSMQHINKTFEPEIGVGVEDEFLRILYDALAG